MEDTKLLTAGSQRASRAACPPNPSSQTQDDAFELTRQKIEEFESRGLAPHPNPSLRDTHLERGMGNGLAGRKNKSHIASHVLSLHARSVCVHVGEPAYQSFYAALPLPSTGLLLAAAIRSSSVRVSAVSEKAANLTGIKMGSSNQSTRVNVQLVTAAWSIQASACLVALGVARSGTTDPRATRVSKSPLQILEGVATPFVVPSTSSTLSLALVTRLEPSSLLVTCKRIARDELERQVISSRIRQNSCKALQKLCERIVVDEEGDLAWASFALVTYLSLEARGRELLAQYPVTDMDHAVAEAMLCYGRSEITRRARLSETTLVSEEFNQCEQPIAEKGTFLATLAELEARDEDDVTSTTDSSTATVDLGVVDGSSSDNDELGNLPPPAPSTIVRTTNRTPTPSVMAFAAASRAASRMEKNAGVNTTVLSAKRKRCTIFSAGTAQLTLLYWFSALTSQHSHILLMLIASTRSAAHDAAVVTLHRQLEDRLTGGHDSVIKSISKTSAVKSAQALRILVKVDDTPRVVAWRAPFSCAGVNVSIARSSEDLEKTALLACKRGVEAAQPTGGGGKHTVVTWVNATHLPSGGGMTAPLPGIVETICAIHTPAPAGTSRARAQASKDRFKQMLKTKSCDLLYTGVARGVITLKTRLVVSEDQLVKGRAMRRLVEEAKERHKGQGRRAHAYEVATQLASDNLEGKVGEPLATPANNLALALQASETLRPLYKAKAHSGNPARVFLGIETEPGEESAGSMHLYEKPNALLAIVDVEFELSHSDQHPRVPSRPDAVMASSGVSFTVAGDSPVRAPEAAVLLSREGHWAESRAILLAAASTACFTDEANNQLTAGALNAAIASAKRVLVPDICHYLHLTPFQVYRVGHRSVKASFPTTAWVGAYGAGLELGVGGGLGRQASAETADRRNHGKCLMPQEIADEYCTALAPEMFQKVSEKTYDKIPVHVRGIPHHAITSVHTFLDQLDSGLERLRDLLGITAHTVESLQCLPFGPYADCLSPNVSPADDPTSGGRFRNRFDRLDSDARCFLVDATVTDAAIFDEPLVRRHQALDAADNPFATIHEHCSVAWSATTTVALLARTLAPDLASGQQIARLKAEITSLHEGDPKQSSHARCVAVDAVVLISSVIYPPRFGIGEPVVLEGYSRVHGQAMRAEPVEPIADPECVAYWAAFTRDEHSAWDDLGAMLVRALEDDGRYDSTISEIRTLKAMIDRLLTNAWLVASPDGVAPPPACHPFAKAKTRADVTAPMLAPVFVDMKDEKTGEWVPPRGAAVGMKPGGYRQLLALMIGSWMPGVVVQQARNEGGLLVRPSSAADILNRLGKPRSDKAVSPVAVARPPFTPSNP